MNLKQLRYFRKAVETGNISQAAAELHVAQTALGLQIRNLEEELGATLLERHSRGVRATECGALLKAHADEILARIEEAESAVRAKAGNRKRIVRLGLTPSIVRLVGNDILTDLKTMLPDASIHIVEEFSFVLSRLLEQDEIDCALTFAPDTDPRYLRRALLEEELFLMTNATGNTGPIPFREAIAMDLALTAKQDVVARELTAIGQRLGLVPNVAYEVQSVRAVKNLVRQGVAVTVMPFGAAESEIRKGELVARHIVSPTVIRTLAFVAPRDGSLSENVAGFDGFVDAVALRLHQCEGPITRLI